MFTTSAPRRLVLAGASLLLITSGCSTKTKATSTTSETVVVEAAETAGKTDTAPPVEGSTSSETTETSAAADTETIAADTPVSVAATIAGSATSGAAADPIPLLTGGSQGAWYIRQRVTNGGTPELPACAKDDELIFDTKGVFISVISGTQCNPSEAEVPKGTYNVSADNTVLTFTTPGFSYTGKIIELTEKTMVLEFDLGPGFVIRDSFAKR
jgi:Lipocalin-like domain